jgi:FkbM family methyltransferase
MSSFNIYEKDIKLKSINKNYLEGFDELKYLTYLKNYFSKKQNINIIDCGANVGSYSVFLSLFLDCNKIFSIEPFDSIFEVLNENLKSNNCSNVQAINIGIGSRESEIILISGIPNNKGAFWFWYNDSKDIDAHRPFNIGYKEHESLFNSNVKSKCNKLDNIIDNNIKIDFIKIDVEGMEVEALNGAKNIIDKHRPLMYVEGSLGTMSLINEWVEKNKYKRIETGLFKKHHYLLESNNEDSPNR